MNKLFIYGSVFFIVVFFLSRLFILIIPIPIVTPDSELYLKHSEVFYKLNFNALASLRDLPVGYPIFLAIIKSIKGTLFTAVLFQIGIRLLAYLTLLYAVFLWNRKSFLFFLLVLSLLSFQHFDYHFDMRILTESIYTSSIIFVVAYTLVAFKTNKLIHYIAIVLFMFIVALYRSNGGYIYFLIVPVLIFMIKTQVPRTYYLTFFSLFFGLNLLWASFNYFARGAFYIGNMQRMQNVDKKVLQDSDKMSKKPYMAKHYFFYFPTRKQGMNYEKTIFKLNDLLYEKKDKYKFYHGKIHPKSFHIEEPRYDKNFIKNKINILYSKEQFEALKGVSDYSDIYLKKKGKIYYLSRYINRKLLTPLMSHELWLIGFYIISIFSIVKYVRFRDEQSLMILTLFFVHILSLIVITIFHSRALMRYEYPTSFIIYLIVALFPLIFDVKISLKRPSYKLNDKKLNESHQSPQRGL